MNNLQQIWRDFILQQCAQINPDMVKVFLQPSKVSLQDNCLVIHLPTITACNWAKRSLKEKLDRLMQNENMQQLHQNDGQQLRYNFIVNKGLQPSAGFDEEKSATAATASAITPFGLTAIGATNRAQAPQTLNSVQSVQTDLTAQINQTHQAHQTNQTDHTDANSNINIESKSRLDHSTGLRKDLTFDNFVSGSANQMAYFHARNFSKNSTVVEGETPSPLYFFGCTGVGKTHLLHAIGNAYLSNFPNAKVKYCTVDEFVFQVVHAYKNDNIAGFKGKFAAFDLFLLDDIQYLSGGKHRTQQEFFFLFNTLIDNRKPIVLACDRPPQDITEMSDRLISRFGWGLTIHILPPEFELRIAILKQKASDLGVSLDDKCAEFIATHIKRSVRELEGALRKVAALSGFINQPISILLCKDALADIINPKNQEITADKIIQLICSNYRITRAELVSASRQATKTRKRQISMYLCRELTNLSLKQIGEIFGNRNHTSVLHSCKSIEKLMQHDTDFTQEINTVKMTLGA